MMECQPSQVLFDYLRQELPLDQAARIEAHLPHCGACREELHRLQQQIRQVQATLAQLDPGPGWPAKAQPDLSRAPSRPVSFSPLLRLAMAFTTAVMLILGGMMHLSGGQSALANSISRLKFIMDVSSILNHTTSMDCTVLRSGAGDENSYYHIRWNASGVTRVDRKSTGGVQQTLWISNTTVPPDPVWQPAMEFLTPAILAQHMERPLMLAEQQDAAESYEFLLVGKENQRIVEIVVDERTYLPKTLKKYLPDSSKTGAEQDCILEVRFLWNQPISPELLIPESQAAKRQIIH